MPRLRFTRDERGYEHTFLVHTAGRRGKERTRILYWFRSPPSVRVGRAALDPDAIRAIEEANPAIAFDWPTILETRPPEPEPAEGWRARRGRPGLDRETQNGSSLGHHVPPASVPPPSGPPGAAGSSGPPVARSVLPAPSDVTQDLNESRDPDGGQDRAVAEPSAVQRVLGSEGLMRVRARYAESLARIATQVSDAAVADELRGLAERLNPDAWVTAEDVGTGLEQFERVLETERQRLGPPRRRRGERREQPAGEPADRRAENVAMAAADEPIPDPPAD